MVTSCTKNRDFRKTGTHPSICPAEANTIPRRENDVSCLRFRIFSPEGQKMKHGQGVRFFVYKKEKSAWGRWAFAGCNHSICKLMILNVKFVFENLQ